MFYFFEFKTKPPLITQYTFASNFIRYGDCLYIMVLYFWISCEAIHVSKKLLISDLQNITENFQNRCKMHEIRDKPGF